VCGISVGTGLISPSAASAQEVFSGIAAVGQSCTDFSNPTQCNDLDNPLWSDYHGPQQDVVGSFGASCTVTIGQSDGEVALYDYNSTSPYWDQGGILGYQTFVVYVHAGSRLVENGGGQGTILAISGCWLPTSPTDPNDQNVSVPHYVVANVAESAATGKLACANNEFGRVDQWWPCDILGGFSPVPATITTSVVTLGVPGWTQQTYTGSNIVAPGGAVWDLSGHTVVQARANSTFSQLWQLDQVTNTATTEIVSSLTGLCASWGSNKTQVPVVTAPCNGSPNQAWMFRPQVFP
jgi:hypothetical protein